MVNKYDKWLTIYEKFSLLIFSSPMKPKSIHQSIVCAQFYRFQLSHHVVAIDDYI